ncbi:ApeA N-terminal domain 1-containing protein (plasmid) [Burkholderia ambifaria]
MSNEIDFSSQYSYVVRVQHDDLGDLGEATLSFGVEHWPHVLFENSSSYTRLQEDKKHPRLRATTKDGKTFTLFDCVVVGFSLAIDYVVAGDVAEFNRIGIRFNDINEWFMPFRSIEEKIAPRPSKVNKDKHICVEIKTGEQAFKLSTETILHIAKSGEDHVVHEHVLFSFERFDGFFSPRDIREKCHELSTLLSILIARPLYLVNVQVVSDDGRVYPVFFSSFKKREQDLPARYWAEYFVTKSSLDGRWQNVFENYYNSEYREVSWVRLAGMQRYEGFWEYRALGYVSLLDKYVSQRSKGLKRKPSKAEDMKYAKVHADLKNISPQLAEGQERGVFSVIEKHFLGGGGRLFFRDKYDYVVGAMDAGILSIINMSSEDFEKIKGIRDAVAHGDAPDLVEADYGRVGVIVSKIALMLTYWAFIDFGLTDDDFLGGLNSHSKLRLRADIDRVQLLRVTKEGGFFSVSKEQFDRLSEIKAIGVQACFTCFGDGRIEYAEHHVAALKAWQKKRISGVVPVAEIFAQSIEKIKCYGEAFIECGDERLELIQAYFIEGA